mmetsp:Transcript_425/g.1452  ORF Transcript_425/g.1452 Transcript_425/m.1452 type:complete len:313 (+) Transcript_425:55-993(+)
MSAQESEKEKAKAQGQIRSGQDGLRSVLPFSSNDAKFMPFSANPALAAIMQASRPEEAEGMRRWLLRVEAAIHEWIVRRCFLDCSEEEAIARCAAYRSLGRGWFIVQLLPQKKFKFWWEEIAQIEGKRAAEIDELRERMDLGDIRHFTRGFVCHNELVFYIRGISHPTNPSARAPSIRIMKWDPTFRRTDLWTGGSEWLESELRTPVPSQQERTEHAATSERNRRRKERQRSKQKQAAAAAAAAAAEAAASEGDKPGEAPRRLAESKEQAQFEELLQSMKSLGGGERSPSAGGDGGSATRGTKVDSGGDVLS